MKEQKLTVIRYKSDAKIAREKSGKLSSKMTSRMSQYYDLFFINITSDAYVDLISSYLKKISSNKMDASKDEVIKLIKEFLDQSKGVRAKIVEPEDIPGAGGTAPLFADYFNILEKLLIKNSAIKARITS